MQQASDRTTYDGRTVDRLTLLGIERANRWLTKHRPNARPIRLTQGSYNPGAVAQSAGTHDGGGAIDGAAANITEAEDWEEALRFAGFAAWVRRTIPGLWGLHVHAIQIGNPWLSAGAKAQVLEYLAGFDGLAGSGRDTGPRQYLRNRTTWKHGGKRITQAEALLERARLLLATGIRGHDVRESRKALRRAINQLPDPQK